MSDFSKCPCCDRMIRSGTWRDLREDAMNQPYTDFWCECPQYQPVKRPWWRRLTQLPTLR